MFEIVVYNLINIGKVKFNFKYRKKRGKVMKSLKSMLSLYVVVCMVFALCAVPALAADTYEIVGDSIILAHKTEAIMLDYTLLKNGEETTATWSISEGGDDISAFAEVDSDGTLYISKDALGKTFTLNAKSDDVTTSINIQVADKYYFEDFESEGEIGDSITSSLFGDGKSNAKVVANGTGKAASATGTTNQTTINNLNLVVALPSEFEALNLNVEADVYYTADAENPATLAVNQGTTLLGLGYADAHYYTRFFFENYDGKISLSKKYNPNKTWTADSRAYVNLPFGEWLSVKCNVKNGTNSSNADDSKTLIITAKDNSTGLYKAFYDTSFAIYGSNDLNEDGSKDALYTNNLLAVGFGSQVDNIKIYSGETTEYTFKNISFDIAGDKMLLRPNVGVSAVSKYSLSAKNAGVDVPQNIVWSISGAPSGVTLPDSSKAEIVVAGNASYGALTLQASSGNTIIASDEITVVEKYTKYSQPIINKERYFDDFENTTYYVVDAPLPGLTSGGSNISPFVYNNEYNGTKDNLPYIREEENGNRYASSIGLHGGRSGCSIVLNPYQTSTNWKYSYANTYTLEADLMAESSATATATGEWTLYAYGAGGSGIDVRYKENADGTISIYHYFKDGSEKTELIAVKSVDEWFDLRVTIDKAAMTYSMWLDNVLVIDNASTNAALDMGGMFGISVDNIAIYTGERYIDDAAAGDSFIILADGTKVENGYSWTGASEKASAAVMLMSDTKDYSGNSLIIALYEASGKLADVKLVEVAKSAAGISVATAEIEAAVTANSRFKAFLINPQTLVPLK